MRQMVARGRQQLESAARLIAGLSPEKPWRIEVARHRERRTLSQNKRYWVAVTELANETGHSKDEMHEALKLKFLPPVMVQVGDDEVIAVPASSAKLDRKIFADYMERVIAFAATEFGIVA